MYVFYAMWYMRKNLACGSHVDTSPRSSVKIFSFECKNTQLLA
jgi:hypothetical protein